MPLAALSLLLCLLPAQQDDTVREFKRYFRKYKETWERVEAVLALEGIDEPAVARVLAPVLEDKDPDVARAAQRVLAQLGTVPARQPLMLILDEGKEHLQMAGILRAAGDGRWQEAVPFARELLQEKDDLLRLCAAEAVGLLGDAEADPDLDALVREDKNAMVRVAAVDALTRLRSASAPAALTLALDDPELPVQTAACLGLRSVRTRDAIPALIRLLEGGKGRLVADIPETLYEITDLHFGSTPSRWRDWWNQAADDYVIFTDAELAKRRAARAVVAAEYHPPVSASFLGVETPSTQVLFVIDISGSMEEEILEREPFLERGITEFSKLEVVKTELRRTIANLGPNVHFNILAFASKVETWKRGLRKANVLNKSSADSFIRKLEPLGGASRSGMAAAGLGGSAALGEGRTNTYAALITALGGEVDEKKGRAITPGPAEKPESDLDTVFFLSDGRPSVGKYVDPDEIRERVRDLNRYRRVVIHTIAIGEFQKDFMEMLARENGGVFVDLGR